MHKMQNKVLTVPLLHGNEFCQYYFSSEKDDVVADPKLGIKRICEACGAKYYDLNKIPAICPKCGASFDPAAFIQATVTEDEDVADNELDNDQADVLDDDVSIETLIDEEEVDDDENAPDLPEFDDDSMVLDDDDDDDDIDLSDDDDDDDDDA